MTNRVSSRLNSGIMNSPLVFTRTGTAGNDSLDGTGASYQMTGYAGDDTYSVDDGGDTVIEASGEGTDTVRSSISYTLVSNVENLILIASAPTADMAGDINGVNPGAINGTGNSLGNVITGNTSANTLSGLDGNDTLSGGSGNDSLSGGLGNDSLDGGTGNDTMAGGAGDDTYVVDATTDSISENASEGTDLVMSAVTWTLGANVENLTLTGGNPVDGTGNTLDNLITGNGANNTLSGSDGADTLSGGAGDDTLSGGAGNDSLDGGAGSDSHAGGAGNDSYYVEDPDDAVVENADEGTDTVYSAFAYTLGDNVENLVLTGSEANNGTGNALANSLTGNSEANILDGASGNDTMAGGVGDDSYMVNATADVIVENASEGTDTVYASASYVLSADIENLELTGTAANATGNAGANSLTGNSEANVIDGAGGADTMTGGDGNDSYYADTMSDLVLEDDGHGTDTVFASAEYYLYDNIENLTLTGSGAINGFGNTQDNVLTGNSGTNVLNGDDGNDTLYGGGDADLLIGSSGNDYLDGGAGIDGMSGGSGNDTYIVDGDSVTERSGGGTDTVLASVTYTLGNYVENLTLTGSGTIDGYGNSLGNVITGNGDNNRLDGGAGADSLTGGTGADTYVVDVAGDHITEIADQGTDEVRSNVTWVLDATLENLILTGGDTINGTGNDGNNAVTGNTGDNLLSGGLGNDTLQGGSYGDDMPIGSDFGHDTLAGGADNDYYAVLTSDTVIIEAADGGTNDIVWAYCSYTLADNVEGAVLVTAGDFGLRGNTSANWLMGNEDNNVLNGLGGDDTMQGGAGNDVYFVNSTGDVTSEEMLMGGIPDAGGIDKVYAALSWELDDGIENLTLTGTGQFNGTGNALNNAIHGNDSNNILTGLDGNDGLVGGLGNDTLYGGAGNDTYYIANAGDHAVEETDGEHDDGGIDTVVTWVDYTLEAYIENLTVSGNDATQATGNGMDNIIRGNGAANAIDGDGGADLMIGGDGNDTYYIDNAGDRVREDDDGGTDAIHTLVTTRLAANIENLYLDGGEDLKAYGNDGENQIVGNSGNNFINGGAGLDHMYGGAGDDTYYVDDSDDVTSEVSTLSGDDGGTDSVVSSTNWTLGNYIENLNLTGADDLTASGNGLDNIIRGNGGNNVIDGGEGADTMSGGTGDDTYYVDGLYDRAQEQAGSGTDLVIATVSFSLRANVEDLTLAGDDSINGYGNDLSNHLIGNGGNNALNGRGGDDTMTGGDGNDTYYVDTELDQVVETTGHGIDTIRSTITLTLGIDVENLTLTGADHNRAYGNELANYLNGNSGNNQLWGYDGNDTLSGGDGSDALYGGLGNDLMAGGAGDDFYTVDSLSDQVRENTGAGYDTVGSLISLVMGRNIECLMLTGSDNINGTGNTLDNTLYGNAGDNHLTGGLGADLFVLHNGGGHDTVMDFNAGQGDQIELEGDGSSLSISQSGNDAVIDLGDGNTVTILNTLATDTGLLGAIVWWQAP